MSRNTDRLLAASAGAVGAGLVAAALDVRPALRETSLSALQAWLAAAGLIAPLSLGVGLGSGVALALLLPQDARRRLFAWLGPSDELTKRERALSLLLVPVALVLWLLVVARWTLFVLASSLEPAQSGGLLGLAAAVLGGLLALGLQLAVRTLAGRFTRAPSPLACFGLSLAACSLFVLFCVLTGAPSGAGNVLSMLGVLTRDELDLRPVGLLALLLAGAVLAPLPARLGVRAACALLALLPLGLTWRAAQTGLEQPQLALALERQAPLASRLLKPLRKLSDRDHDGYSARFGGGDCDDTRAEVNPDANDVPGNGRDEDCSGSDARRELAGPAEPARPSGDARSLALAQVPQGLNVVLLTIDTLRYDLGYTGNPRRVSPELDRLAEESVVFERAYSLASYTAKSLPPMLIGRYASETHRGWSHFNRFEKADPFVAERLAAAGVHTISVQGHWYFFQNYGMERGFAVIDSSAAPRAAQAAEGDRSVTSERLSDAVMAQLTQQAGSKPFFLWAHYTDPHAEYVPHEGFDFGAGSRASYDSEVAFVDRHIGRVLSALRASPLWANTALIVTSDHGEAFGEHGMIRHGFELWEELVRVPLLVRVPGAKPHRVSARRSAIDVVPTILELFRQPLPELGASDFLSGKSLLPELFLPAGYTPGERPVFVDMAEGPFNAERRALIEGDSKLVMSAGRPLGLYDLAQDPAEKRDLSPDRAKLDAAVERFRGFRRTLREITVRAPR